MAPALAPRARRRARAGRFAGSPIRPDTSSPRQRSEKSATVMSSASADRAAHTLAEAMKQTQLA
ncbi:hypothetical protein [Streptomyces sp. NRRL F-2799]|uniref:hypothetical protein n=1 Tax=Streptomyces sp. NRRL F-2799 TaxID=1463844 RepID=UPI0004CBC845|nr:hypothetical protein [Streptomyces sp. NRRL F-2799]